MRYAIAVLFALSTLGFAQNSASALNAIPGSAVQVLYVVDATNLYTYNIDPQTLLPELMGTTPLPKTQLNGIVASVNGKFLYLMASDPYPATNNRVYVYDTNEYGVPSQPLQSVSATGVYSIFVDPTTKFLYGVHPGATYKNQTQASSIYLYQINSTNGELTGLANEATYILNNQATNSCSLYVAGMNASGTEIYDYVFCGTHEGANGTYDERTVDPSTGALGSPQTLLSWSVDTDSDPDSVQFVKSLIFDFKFPVDAEPYNELLVYPLSNSTNPLITCTATMLQACASDIGTAHPSAKYVFFSNAQTNTTEVDAVDLGSKQIVATGTTFATPEPNWLRFSPDGSVVYAWDTEAAMVSVFGFNATTAAITPGGSLSQSNIFSVLGTVRY